MPCHAKLVTHKKREKKRRPNRHSQLTHHLPAPLTRRQQEDDRKGNKKVWEKNMQDRRV
jgi:hypothetical protein